MAENLRFFRFEVNRDYYGILAAFQLFGVYMFNLKEFLGLGFYTSELDQFLEQYEKTHPQLSDSQRKEVEKFKRIYQLRDKPAESTRDDSNLWDKF